MRSYSEDISDVVDWYLHNKVFGSLRHCGVLCIGDKGTYVNKAIIDVFRKPEGQQQP